MKKRRSEMQKGSEDKEQTKPGETNADTVNLE
jgi:hypothetical protein